MEAANLWYQNKNSFGHNRSEFTFFIKTKTVLAIVETATSIILKKVVLAIMEIAYFYESNTV